MSVLTHTSDTRAQRLPSLADLRILCGGAAWMLFVRRKEDPATKTYHDALDILQFLSETSPDIPISQFYLTWLRPYYTGATEPAHFQLKLFRKEWNQRVTNEIRARQQEPESTSALERLRYFTKIQK